MNLSNYVYRILAEALESRNNSETSSTSSLDTCLLPDTSANIFEGFNSCTANLKLD